MYQQTVKILDCFENYTEKMVVDNRLFRGSCMGQSYHFYEVYRPKKKVYMIDENDKTRTLRAMKVLKVWYGSYNSVLFYVKIAGIGYVYTTATAWYYASKEAYEKGEICTIWDETAPLIKVSDCAKEFGVLENFDSIEGDMFSIHRWKWENNCAVCTESHFAMSYDMETGIVGLVSCDKDAYCYRTEEDAKKANAIAVCDFDDEDEGEEKEVWVDVTTSFQFSSKMNEEEIKDKIRETFGDKNYRAFIDQKLVIDNA